MRLNEYRLIPFPADGDLWHLDWFGEVSLDPEAGEAGLQVLLSKVDEAKLAASDAKMPADFLLKDERRIVTIGLGCLPFLWIGSL